LAGCAQDGARWNGERPPHAVDIVDRIEILSLPAAINLDTVPGPDGLRVQVYLFQYAQDQPVTAAGTLEFLVFDRKVGAGEIYTVQPFETWSFQGEQLGRYLGRSLIGWNYSMELRWQTSPAARTLTLVARYTPPAGQPVHSSPVMISMGAR